MECRRAMHLTPSTLSEEHEELLLELITEIAGKDSDEELFVDLLLWLMEDISGFEGMSAARTRRITNYFWRKYCGQKPY
jgi:hypothetical protein